MNIKAVVFDIDGTLTTETDHVVPPSAIDACKRLNEKGVKIIVATGRCLSSLAAIDGIIFPDYYIGSGGSIIKDASMKTLWQSNYSKELFKRIYDYFIEQQMGVLWKFENRAYGWNDDGFWQKLIDDGEQIDMNMENIGDSTPNSFSFVASEEKMKQFQQDFQNELFVCNGGHYVYDVEQIGINKGTCLKRLANMLGLQLSEIAAFGDSENDISILQTAGLAIAMGNGMESLKKVADYVCENASDDGIEKALKKFSIL